jgi:hypothetical protein
MSLMRKGNWWSSSYLILSADSDLIIFLKTNPVNLFLTHNDLLTLLCDLRWPLLDLEWPSKTFLTKAVGECELSKLRQFLALNDSQKKLEIEIVRFKRWLLRGENERLADWDTVLGQDPRVNVGSDSSASTQYCHPARFCSTWKRISFRWGLIYF